MEWERGVKSGSPRRVVQSRIFGPGQFAFATAQLDFALEHG